MKKIAYLILLLITTVFTLGSCSKNEDDDIITDVKRIGIVMTVCDQNGNDLLDTTYSDNILAKQKPVIIFKGIRHELSVDINNRIEPDCGYHFFWLETGMYKKDGKFINNLDFAPIFVDVFDEEPLTIDWGDGTKDVITMTNEKSQEANFSFRLNDGPIIHNWFRFDIVKTR